MFARSPARPSFLTGVELAQPVPTSTTEGEHGRETEAKGQRALGSHLQRPVAARSSRDDLTVLDGESD
jgi:hypothetical protein